MLIRIAKLFGSSKAKLFIEGRTNWQSILIEKSKNLSLDRRIWFHCASLGEFEQGRPVIDLLKKNHPEINIILSFFSPSGYEIRKNYANANIVTYLPIDSSKNAQQFLEIIKPDMVIFVKYEFWYFYLKEIAKRNIPSLLIAAVFEPNQIFFKSYGSLHRKMLETFSQIFTQNEASSYLLQKINISSIICGDSRIDRVLDIPKSVKKYNNVAIFANNQPLIIAGSTWSDDEEILANTLKLLPENCKLLIVPHEVDESHIDKLLHLFKSEKVTIWDSGATELMNARVAIVNTVGHLSALYQYATLVWIGGGFNKSGIHNTLEPAAFGKPIAFGPNYKKFPEAINWVNNANGLFTNNAVELANWCTKILNNNTLLTETQLVVFQYLEKSKGATVIICDYIKKVFN